MYRWWLYAHLASVIGFVLSHGFSAVMGLILRRQESADVIRLLTEISKNSTGITYAFLVLVLITGISLGFQGAWWGYRWIWAALVILILTMGAMAGLANRYNRVRTAAGVQPRGRGRQQITGRGEDLLSLVAAANPWPITALGVVALLLLLWLMILKPF